VLHLAAGVTRGLSDCGLGWIYLAATFSHSVVSQVLVVIWLVDLAEVVLGLTSGLGRVAYLHLVAAYVSMGYKVGVWINF